MSFTSKGSTKEIWFKSHPISVMRSFTSHLDSSQFSGPWMRRRRGHFLVQFPYQKLNLLSLPTIHMLPALKTSLPFFIAAQIREQGSLSALGEAFLLLLQYLALRTLAQRASLSTLNLQLSLPRRAAFLPLADCNPRPPSSLGLVTLFHPTQWIFLAFSEEPQRKLRLTRSNPSRILTGRWVHCITYEGMAAVEAWMRTARPANDNKLHKFAYMIWLVEYILFLIKYFSAKQTP